MSLQSARSAYLKSAAHQPVQWREWGDEAFAAARDQDRPVLLDIGAVWCHWCHVMDGESYEDASLAGFLNQHFICIKVDRDERPDVDTRYQRAVQTMTGQGGWPLTAFLTPGGEVFYGGTYFPPEDRYGRPGFRTVLGQVLRFWREDRERALEHAASIRRAIAERTAAPAAEALTPSAPLAAERRMLAFFDPVFAGFGSAPKFPHPGGIRFLLTRWVDGGSSESLLAARETLRAMARGGIHDHLGGGFHRYSVDRQWMIPHFEKMSYDNSELLRAYADAAALLDDDELRAAAASIVRWVREVLALDGGGYGTSQDADIGPDDDGSYFTWTQEEMAAVLTPPELEVATTRFGLGTAGVMPHDPARNVLFDAGQAGGRDDVVFESAARKLRAARASRPTPFVDRTAYTSWNAMMVSSMLRAAAVLDDAWAREQALATLTNLKALPDHPPSRLPHAAGVDGLLEDQVFTAAAAIDAFEVTGDSSWLDWSVAIMEATWDAHHDRGGGLRDIAQDRGGTGLLDVSQVPIEDAPVPSPNGVAAEVCARLHAHTAEPRWAVRHRTLVEAFASIGPSLGLHGAAWCLGADWLLNPPAHLVVVGADGDAVADGMHRAALAAAVPRRVIRRLRPADDPGTLPAELLAMLAGSGPAGYVCVGTRCLAPARTLEEWSRRLAEVTRKAPG
ncbi:MAG TPA: thioredoxin domain-containing protein [Gemmatimonadales bacterium]|nr:thioredoxin domain-containing protein [Gemmatimonadales bacterium]